MALSRSNSKTVSGSIWPGFVDAMTALLMILMFVLTIFMIVQFVLRETVSGQQSELDALSTELNALSDALGIERALTADLNALLKDATDRISGQDALIAALTTQTEEQGTKIASFEAQVASLLAQNSDQESRIASLLATQEQLEAANANVISEKEAVQLALAQARDEIDVAAEEARLAAQRREALEALVADLQTENETQAVRISQTEADLLVEAAAAEALRERLARSENELTAMSLALEEQRKQAEETLTILAAAEAARNQLEADNATVLTEIERERALLAQARALLSEEEAQVTESQERLALLNAQTIDLRRQLNQLQALLDSSNQRDADAQVQLEVLGQNLNTALAQVAAEQKKRAELEEAERKRLEEEAKELANFRSEFFGRMRQLLEGQDQVRIVGDRFVFASEVLFAPGSATLGETGKAEIAQVADILLNVARDIPEGIDWVLQVDGHTDNIPVGPGRGFEDNWDLSQARALSVVRFMSAELGFPPQRLSANGFGEYQPIDPTNTVDARAVNRRIELKLTEK
ncbi:MAG: peptidoglycan -binding protein [Pseudomonadota bacterium]